MKPYLATTKGPLGVIDVEYAALEAGTQREHG